MQAASSASPAILSATNCLWSHCVPQQDMNSITRNKKRTADVKTTANVTTGILFASKRITGASNALIVYSGQGR